VPLDIVWHSWGCFDEANLGLFVSAFFSFWPPKAGVDYQTLSFSACFYKNRFGKNHPKST
jgi:hypothetical protein